MNQNIPVCVSKKIFYLKLLPGACTVCMPLHLAYDFITYAHTFLMKYRCPCHISCVAAESVCRWGSYSENSRVADGNNFAIHIFILLYAFVYPSDLIPYYFSAGLVDGEWIPQEENGRERHMLHLMKPFCTNSWTSNRPQSVRPVNHNRNISTRYWCRYPHHHLSIVPHSMYICCSACSTLMTAPVSFLTPHDELRDGHNIVYSRENTLFKKVDGEKRNPVRHCE